MKLNLNEISGNLLQIVEDVLGNKYQRAFLNGQVPLLFSIYIKDLSNELSSNPRLFADDTSLFLVALDTNLSANALNNDLLKTY